MGPQNLDSLHNLGVLVGRPVLVPSGADRRVAAVVSRSNAASALSSSLPPLRSMRLRPPRHARSLPGMRDGGHAARGSGLMEGGVTAFHARARYFPVRVRY